MSESAHQSVVVFASVVDALLLQYLLKIVPNCVATVHISIKALLKSAL